MKIAVLDGYTENPGDISWEPISTLGDLIVYDRTSYDLKNISLIIERAKDAEILFTNKTPITREVIDNLPKLKYIGVLATGFNIVDTSYAKEKGIMVSNIPTYGTAAVAQFATALLLEMCHHVGEHSASVLKGDWQESRDFCYWNYPLVEVYGKTLGLIGFGRIGKAFSKVAQALGMNILVYDINQDKSLESDMLTYVPMEQLLKSSDVISLHCPLTPENEGIINSANISLMKNGVMLINTSRGSLICEKDLVDALKSGKIAFAALDVVSTEPIKEDNPLLKAKNIIITPHIAWAPKESRQRLMDIAGNNLKQYLAGNPINIVNK
jgi:glycerate dehydrogenase